MSEQKTQFQKNLIRMWDSLREESFKGKSWCGDIEDCKTCPLYECCYGNSGNTLFKAEKIIEIVNNWAKEHPIATNEQKYEETFGVKPITARGTYLCPSNAGWFRVVNCSKPCSECAPNFWKSEYKPPKKEESE